MEETVGQRLLTKAGVLIEILSHEPKHAALDSAYLELKDAVELMRGRPARETANFTSSGERLVVPATDALEAGAGVPEAAVAVPASKLGDDGKVTKKGKSKDQSKGQANGGPALNASSEQGTASSNGDSGAPSGQTVQSK